MFADGGGPEPLLARALSAAPPDHPPHQGAAAVPRRAGQTAAREYALRARADSRGGGPLNKGTTRRPSPPTPEQTMSSRFSCPYRTQSGLK